VRLLTVLLELEGDNEGKTKAAQYPEKNRKRSSLRLAKVSVFADKCGPKRETFIVGV